MYVSDSVTRVCTYMHTHTHEISIILAVELLLLRHRFAIAEATDDLSSKFEPSSLLCDPGFVFPLGH